MINVQQLIMAGIQPTPARQFVGPLNDILPKFGITTGVRIAAFVAQCKHESAGFTHLEESLFYRTPERVRQMWPTRVTSLGVAATLCCKPELLANTVYSGRNGNGDFASGDGWLFRGRGLIGTTGRQQYALAGFEANPDDVGKPIGAVLAACKYWSRNNLNSLADGSQTDSITRIINGPGMAGRDERRENFREAVLAFK